MALRALHLPAGSSMAKGSVEAGATEGCIRPATVGPGRQDAEPVPLASTDRSYEDKAGVAGGRTEEAPPEPEGGAKVAFRGDRGRPGASSEQRLRSSVGQQKEEHLPSPSNEGSPFFLPTGARIETERLRGVCVCVWRRQQKSGKGLQATINARRREKVGGWW